MTLQAAQSVTVRSSFVTQVLDDFSSFSVIHGYQNPDNLH